MIMLKDLFDDEEEKLTKAEILRLTDEELLDKYVTWGEVFKAIEEADD